MADSKRERIAAIFQKLADENSLDAYCAWKDYCEDAYPEDEVFDMDTFDDVFCDTDPWQVARDIHFGEFNPCHNYFWFNGYGNLESSDRLVKSPFDADALAESAIDGDRDYGIPEVREILNEPDSDAA